jgi:hypothetical protein
MNPLKISPSDLPPERHADRVVAEMLQHIARDQQERRSRPYLLRKASAAGNPKAQERLVGLLRKSGGIAVINIEPAPASGRQAGSILHRDSRLDRLGRDARRRDKPRRCCP